MERHARGFTLIEMLVVIGVVALLALIFWPGCICTDSERARKASCLSHMKQIGLAAAMYLQDYDDTFFWNPQPGGLPASSWGPEFRTRNCAPQPSTSFLALMAPYVKGNASVFQCSNYPGYDRSRHLGYASSLDSVAFPWADRRDPAWVNKIGYGFNERLIASPCRPRKLSSLKHDAREVALFADAERPWASTEGVWVKPDGQWDRYWAVDPAAPPRHHDFRGQDFVDGQNFVYADGHARFLPAPPPASGSSGMSAEAGYYPSAKLE